MSDVTSILEAAAGGDPQAAQQLLPLVYDELRKLAAAKLAHEKPGQTLQATALVHKAYRQRPATSWRYTGRRRGNAPQPACGRPQTQESGVRRQESERKGDRLKTCPTGCAKRKRIFCTCE